MGLIRMGGRLFGELRFLSRIGSGGQEMNLPVDPPFSSSGGIVFVLFSISSLSS